MVTRSHKEFLFFFGLHIFLALYHSPLSYSANRCDSLFGGLLVNHAGAPSGKLTLIKKTEPGRPGGLYKDEKGIEWNLKADIRHPELQTSAEVISSEVYRHFGYLTPETHIVEVEGRRYSASIPYHSGTELNFRTDLPDTSQFRGMRIVAAFLNDWDRVNSGTNKLLPDGNILLHEFGSTLGSGAKGEHKPGLAFSPALGPFSVPDPSTFSTRPSIEVAVKEDFRGPHPMKELFDSYDVSMLPKSHPWLRLTAADAHPIVEKFRTLDTKKIEEIVDKAHYSGPMDRSQMIESLILRRDAFLEYLEGYLGGEPFRSGSYWALKSPVEDLSFSVRENRSPQIGRDVQDFVEKLEVPPDELIFFRGQSQLTKTVYAPSYQEGPSQRTLPQSKGEQQEILNGYLHSAYRDLNPFRREQRRFRFFAGMGDIPFWDKATAFDLLAERHSISNGLPIFVSVSRRLDVASRWVEDPRFSTLYRYVYILGVPQKEALPITRVLRQKMSRSNDEAEWVIPFDATPYVKSVYDTFENRFIDWPLTKE